MCGLEWPVHGGETSDPKREGAAALTTAASSGLWIGLAAHKSCAACNGMICRSAHQALSLPCRCSSWWWARHSGTVNSSLTLRPRARLGKFEVVGIGRSLFADETGLSPDEVEVRLAARAGILLGEREPGIGAAAMDLRLVGIDGPGGFRQRLRGRGRRHRYGWFALHVAGRLRCGLKLPLVGGFHAPRVVLHEGVLERQARLGPVQQGLGGM